MTKHALTVAMEFFMQNLIVFQQFQHRLCTGLQRARTHPVHADLVCTTIDHVKNFCDCK